MCNPRVYSLQQYTRSYECILHAVTKQQRLQQTNTPYLPEECQQKNGRIVKSSKVIGN